MSVAPTAAEIAASEPTMTQRLAEEGLGTFVLVLFGCSTALLSGGDYAAIALAFGLAVLCMAYAVGHISGGHFNPAVSLGAAITGRMSWRETGIYAAVQVAGGVVAALVLLVITKLYSVDGALAQVSNNYKKTDGSWDWLGGFIAELVATAVFVFIILAVTDKRREGTGIPAPIAIGLALTLVHLGTLGLTGTGVNPARSFGPALFAGWDSFQQVWLFILAPLAGAALAGFGYPAVFGWDRERPVRSPRASRTPAPPQGWDPSGQQQWAGGEPGQAWQQPPAPWGQPEAPSQAQQQWAGGTPGQAWQAPPAPPGQEWGQPYAQPYGQEPYAPDPYAQDPYAQDPYAQPYPQQGYPQQAPPPYAEPPVDPPTDDPGTQIRPADS